MMMMIRRRRKKYGRQITTFVPCVMSKNLGSGVWIGKEGIGGGCLCGVVVVVAAVVSGQ